ncbi:hypothetical protein RMSM_06647 [Rhodopirellula maiorica SM1]|uniref:Uncharacterized protein n=1 Tax=Rhodopirellula maiorica SM1 TaxID=1265738 RepID=M5RAN0_9BACT|nr:hypothetical protein RMSM_06647 [Rhodopirellula maiorica SM1]
MTHTGGDYRLNKRESDDRVCAQIEKTRRGRFWGDSAEWPFFDLGVM